MKIQVHGNNIAVTSALQEYVDKKVGKLSRFLDNNDTKQIYVTLAVDGTEHRVEVTIHCRGVIFRAEERSTDMYASIDMVADKLEQQVHRYKEKIARRGRHRQFKVSDESADDHAEDPFQVIRTKRFAMKPMDVQEAILQMNLLGHDFFVFRNGETDEVNVVYKRKNGDYGLIEPQV
ncbi:ribosome hibernation-promoting factor, HPF/YfiA family [Alicyclobacillus mali (ex Roth et al. 2021)]|uniref:ribosome hibernation-promoting factor, HPF/YfiA family n=1 Tax=Alicyclobacillus mali (ex Roth et al. 2021) TaxID=1123961 RepID=UPI001A8DA087|nr:ribosome-associated translation inhibitor RaiA [Alicyclobacillus mali (ex Roth et al. 2021)]